MANKAKGATTVIDSSTPEGRKKLLEAMQNLQPSAVVGQVKQQHIQTSDPLIFILSDEAVFKRLDSYKDNASRELVSIFIEKQRASINLINAQAEALHSVPDNSRMEHKIIVRGQYFCFFLLVLAMFFAWLLINNHNIGSAVAIIVAVLAPSVIGAFFQPVKDNHANQHKNK